VPPEAIAIRSFVLKIGSYRGIISLNISKPMYQTSYIISKDTEKLDEEKPEIYLETFKDVLNDNTLIGFQDIINSAESGDTIQILLSRNKKSIDLNHSTFVKNVSINIDLISK
jgi:hypothetical protein